MADLQGSGFTTQPGTIPHTFEAIYTKAAGGRYVVPRFWDFKPYPGFELGSYRLEKALAEVVNPLKQRAGQGLTVHFKDCMLPYQSA